MDKVREPFTAIMKYIHLYIFIFLIVEIMAGCAHTSNDLGASISSPTNLFDTFPINVNDKTEKEYERQQRILYHLSYDNPKRMTTLNTIVEKLSHDFYRLPKEMKDERFNIFSKVVLLYSPRDIENGKISPQLAQMAQWTIETFEKGSNEEKVIAAYTILAILDSRNIENRQRLDQILEWSENSRCSLANEIERLNQLIELYENIFLLTPTIRYKRKLENLYLDRYMRLRSIIDSTEEASYGNFKDILQVVGYYEYQKNYALSIIRLNVRYDSLEDALTLLSPLSGNNGIPQEYLDLLYDVQGDGDNPKSLLRLSDIAGKYDSETGLKLCINGESKYPSDPLYPLCTAKYYEKAGNYWSAWEEYQEAIYLEKEDTELLINACRILAMALNSTQRQGHSEEPLIYLSEANRFIENLHRNTEMNEDLKESISDLQYAMGKLAYESGEIDEANNLLGLSNSSKRNIDALIQLAEIEYNLGNTQNAILVYSQCLEIANIQVINDKNWQRANILERMGDIYHDIGQERRCGELYQAALREWGIINKTLLGSPEHRLTRSSESELLLRQGVLLYKLGREDLSKKSFQIAIQNESDDTNIFSTLMSLYCIDGNMNDAVQVYRMAYYHDGISEAWKAYFAMWIYGMFEQLDDRTNTMAKNYLSNFDGIDWISCLALFMTGRMKYEELLEKTKNKGERAEAYFYQALMLRKRGMKIDAKELFKEVISTKMMGYFEYQFSKRILAKMIND